MTSTDSKADLLLRAATDVFYEHGFHGAKVSDITAAAGVAQGTFYLYFPSKDRIFEELLLRFAADLQEAVLAFSWSDVGDLDELTAELHRVLVSIFTVCAEQRKAAALFFESAPAVGGQAAMIPKQFVRAAEEIVVGYLTDGMKMGHVRPLDVRVVARAIAGYVLHTVAWTIIEEGRQDRLDELAEELLEFELYGILARAKGSP